MRPRRLFRLCLATLVVVAVAALPGAQGATGLRTGGIFKVSFQGSSSLQAFDHIDPALAYSRESWALLDTVCARLMRYRDAQPPRGYQLIPEVAGSPPTESDGGRTWTFRLRNGFRFSNGQPVRADAFARAIHRAMAPGVDSPGYAYTRTIVGAEDVHAGKARSASGVNARGNTLAVRFTRPVGAFDAWTTMPFFCAVPPRLPPDPEGIHELVGAGPYYIREYRPNQRIVIRRNRHYGGTREYHVDGFDVDLSASTAQEVLDRIEAGKADWGYALAQAHFGVGRGLIPKYRLNQDRFFVDQGLTMAVLAINSSGPVFRDNPSLRRAINLALDRDYFASNRAAAWRTDQLLPPGVAGFRDREIYPFGTDLARAEALAAGNLRGGKAIMYFPDSDHALGCAQCVQEQLAKIGLDVEIKPFGEFATASAYLGRLGEPDEPWDLALVLWSPDFVDPFAYINRLLDSEDGGGTGLGGFHEGKYVDLMRRAARLRGAARTKAYAELDLLLARDTAPLLPIYVVNEAPLVSARVDPKCMLRRPGLVLTTVCLKR